MFDFHRHHIFFNSIIRLSDEEQENPAEVITSFFQENHLSSIRKALTDLTLTFITANDQDTQADQFPFQRSSMLEFQEELECFIEAVYIQSGLQRKEA